MKLLATTDIDQFPTLNVVEISNKQPTTIVYNEQLIGKSSVPPPGRKKVCRDHFLGGCKVNGCEKYHPATYCPDYVHGTCVLTKTGCPNSLPHIFTVSSKVQRLGSVASRNKSVSFTGTAVNGLSSIHETLLFSTGFLMDPVGVMWSVINGSVPQYYGLIAPITEEISKMFGPLSVFGENTSLVFGFLEGVLDTYAINPFTATRPQLMLKIGWIIYKMVIHRYFTSLKDKHPRTLALNIIRHFVFNFGAMVVNNRR